MLPLASTVLPSLYYSSLVNPTVISLTRNTPGAQAVEKIIKDIFEQLHIVLIML